MSIESLTRKAIHTFGLLEEGIEAISVALSGGKDSLTLLWMLKQLSGRGFPPFRIEAIHVAGSFSCGPALQGGFLQKICDDLQVPLTVMESTQKLETLECYGCSRERRRLLFDAAKRLEAPTIAFGHHRDDSVQTLLMNLLQKAEFAANLPRVHMVHFGVTIIRPLILVSEKEIVNFAKEKGYLRITCQCPVGARSRRMDVKRLITQLEEFFPNAASNLALAGINYGSRKAEVP